MKWQNPIRTLVIVVTSECLPTKEVARTSKLSLKRKRSCAPFSAAESTEQPAVTVLPPPVVASTSSLPEVEQGLAAKKPKLWKKKKPAPEDNEPLFNEWLRSEIAKNKVKMEVLELQKLVLKKQLINITADHEI